MDTKKYVVLIQVIFLVALGGCSFTKEGGMATPQSATHTQNTTGNSTPTGLPVNSVAVEATEIREEFVSRASEAPTRTASPTSTIAPTPRETEIVFEVGREITIQYLRDLEITGSEVTFEEKLPDRSNYHQHIVSYISEGNKIYGLLTIPFAEPPESGYKAIVFNHGYIPPTAYRTTERYNAFVDYLARSGFVVLKIDYKRHKESQGETSGSYFSPGYTID